jgi:hypothetical protein
VRRLLGLLALSAVLGGAVAAWRRSQRSDPWQVPASGGRPTGIATAPSGTGTATTAPAATGGAPVGTSTDAGGAGPDEAVGDGASVADESVASAGGVALGDLSASGDLSSSGGTSGASGDLGDGTSGGPVLGTDTETANEASGAPATNEPASSGPLSADEPTAPAKAHGDVFEVVDEGTGEDTGRSGPV